MKAKTLFQNVRSSAAVALGVTAIFGATFAVTTLVASAAEEQAPVPPAPSVEVQAPAPAPAPRSDAPPPRPGRPAFKDFDTNGDGSITSQEFEAFRPAGPPPRFNDRARGGRPGDEGQGGDFRAQRFDGRDDRYGPPPPPDDRHAPPRRDDRYGPPPGDDRYGPPRGPRGGSYRDERGPRPRGGPRGGEYGPPPGGPEDEYGRPDDRRGPPPRRPGE